MQDGRIREMEADLERLVGVHTARIQTEEGEISEVHVVSHPDRRPKWVVRDVVTTIFAKHGIRVPYQKVSVAGCAPACETPVAVGSAAPGRTELASVHLGLEGGLLRAAVGLRNGHRAVDAAADRPATRANRLRVVAEATLEAVRRLAPGACSYHLEEVSTVTVGGLQVVLAHVVHLSSYGERSLVGSSPGEDGRIEAAAHAVLDAVAQDATVEASPREEIEYEVEEDPAE